MNKSSRITANCRLSISVRVKCLFLTLSAGIQPGLKVTPDWAPRTPIKKPLTDQQPLNSKLPLWSEGLKKNHFYAFSPSPPLYSVDKTLSFNTSLHFTIFRHWKGAGEQRLIFLAITVMIHVFDIFKHNLSMVVGLIDWYGRDIIQKAWWKQVFKKLNLFTSYHLVLRYNPLSPLQKLLSKMP